MPIRSLDTHEALPGIEVGEVGEKLGYNSVDNGFLAFNHVRVPRKALLSRFMNITKEGDFKMKANPKIIYQIMVQTRISIVTGAALNYHKAAKIAVRYAVCRRQFRSIKGSDDERKLMDYQLHMDTIMSNLCKAIVFSLVVADLAEVEGKSQREVANGSFKLLDILHHFSSGMKALMTEMAYKGIDDLR